MVKHFLGTVTPVPTSREGIRLNLEQLLAKVRPAVHDRRGLALRKSSIRLLYLLGLGAYLAYLPYDAWA